MSAIIITGYTGTRHITPSMDAAVYRGAFGDENCVLAEGNQCAGTMASINEFTVASGCVTMQGHAIQISQETLDVSTCATGYARIDLVCVRFKHNTSSLVDSAELVVLEGDAVSDSNTPQPPAYSTGTIDEGATQVDFPLYQITAYGSTVTFEPMFSVTTNLEDCTLSDATIAKWDAILGISVMANLDQILDYTADALTPVKTTFTPDVGSNVEGWGGCWYKVCGRFVQVHIGVSGISGSWTGNTVYTMPEGLRPPENIDARGSGQTANSMSQASINSTGVIRVYSANTYANVVLNYFI